MKIDLMTAEGNAVNYGNIYQTKVQLSDILKHVVNMRRYIGAIDVRLAAHLVLCAEILEYEPGIRLKLNNYQDPIASNLTIQKGYATGHDFHEYITNDLPTGLKPYLPEFNRIEFEAENHVHNSIGLPLSYRNEEIIKLVDAAALVIEMSIYQHPAATRIRRKFNSKYPDVKLLPRTQEYKRTLSYRNDLLASIISDNIAKAKIELQEQIEE